MKHACLVLGVAALAVVAESPRAAAPTAGAVVAVGGGAVGDEVFESLLDLAGGKAARVVVLPQASSREDAGAASVARWRAAGALHVELADGGEPSTDRERVGAADLIWMGGGSQVRLLDALAEADLADLVRARHAEGAVVAGTSAGAAVLSERTITGHADLESITAGATRTRAGLGLLGGVIVDQHALRRRRLNRLVSAVLDAPHLLGVAVDEGTAAVVHDGRISVLGTSSVVVVDGRTARVERAAEGSPAAGTGLALHVLREGMTLASAAPKTEER
ncbi:MAG: cyanophycinase [Planctomycetota bacterium]|jgi:cyanophycinase|nr:cyanophycinase [Planctomycetota bacterium]MDP6763606.1 cyanophycinase [Planctomycetota bacterium]MDP6989713.1 cyanophycinase [Planctomycetota bacterium]